MKNNIPVGGIIFDSIMIMPNATGIENGQFRETYCNNFENVARECGFKYVKFKSVWNENLSYDNFVKRFTAQKDS